MSRWDFAKVVGTSFASATSFEFKMQIRRKVLWIVMALFVVWSIVQFSSLYLQGSENLPTTQVVAGWSIMLQAIMPLAVGALLVDRLLRDTSTGIKELLETLPTSAGGHLLGKFLGSTLAAIAPMFLAYVAMIFYVAGDRGDIMVLPLGLLSFVTVNLPGLLFVAAFSISCPVVLGMPLYLFLFVGYWFWSALLSPESGIPTLSGTWLSPLGETMANGFFGARTLYANGAAAWEGVVSAALLLVFAAYALLCAHVYLRWRQNQQ